MDAIPIPACKKHNFVRASAEQLFILKDSFAGFDIPSKQTLAELSEKTGLTPKWISSWFMRERKKVKKSKLSRQEIVTFKQEYNDLQTPFTNEPLQLATKPKNVDLKATKNEMDCSPEIPAQPLAQTQRPTSFILRPMVPVIYQPQTPCSNFAPSSRSDDIKPAPPSHHFSGNPVIVSSSPPIAIHPGFLAPRSSRDDRSGSRVKKTGYTDTPSQVFQSRHACSPAQLTGQGYHCAYKPLRPLLPRDHSSQPPELLPVACNPCSHDQTFLDRTDKENHLPRNQSYASQSRSVSVKGHAPRFHGQPLTLSHSYVNQDNSYSVPQPSQIPDYPASEIHPRVSSHQSQQLPPLWYGEAYSQQLPFSALLDPALTPLKHLSVLAPFNLDGLSHDAIISRVLDERLAQEDPFQATMGLVFASRLGLEWSSSASH